MRRRRRYARDRDRLTRSTLPIFRRGLPPVAPPLVTYPRGARQELVLRSNLSLSIPTEYLGDNLALSGGALATGRSQPVNHSRSRLAPARRRAWGNGREVGAVVAGGGGRWARAHAHLLGGGGDRAGVLEDRVAHGQGETPPT
jgi:hypothetical protein